MVEELSMTELKGSYGWGRLRHGSDGELAHDPVEKVVETIR
jgi:hypothetical protein